MYGSILSLLNILLLILEESVHDAGKEKGYSRHHMRLASLTVHSFTLSASDDIQRADEVRALVKDIWDLRLAKLRKSIDVMITQQETFGKVLYMLYM